MSYSVEKLIEEWLAEQEIEELPGTGKPLDLDEYFSWPEDQRIGLSLLKNSGCVPMEVERLREIKRLSDEIEKCTDAPALIVRVAGKNRNHDTLPESWPATTLLPLGWNFARRLAFLTAFRYSAMRARRSARADGIVAVFGSTFTRPDIPGCTRQMYL